MNLYLKYRPSRLEELDLDGVRRSLTKSLVSNKLAHAYFFSGPRGAGKTSAARILARVANCEKNRKKLSEPCNECAACRSIRQGSAVDVLEIDAASNRGIDDVRELKEKIRLSPAQLPMKVYIIDEVHMMTTEAFNALLKTLEEPPAHAMFILCTTEAHKVPETIVSRCVKINFTKATEEELMRSLQRVVKGEKAEVDKEALRLIANQVDGSFRDGVKILDQLLARGKKVEVKEVEEVLFGMAGYNVDALAQSLVGSELDTALAIYRQSISEGVELTHLLVSLMNKLRELVVNEREIELVELIYEIDGIARKLADSPVPTILPEMAMVKWCMRGREGGGKKGEGKEPPHVSKKRGEKVIEKEKRSISREEVVREEPEKLIVKKVEYKGSSSELWQGMMQGLNGDSYSLGALLSRAKPGLIQGDQLTIEVGYEFHKEQIMQEKHRARIEAIISEVVKQPMRIKCEVVSEAQIGVGREVSLQTGGEVDRMADNSSEEDALMEEAVEIFGS